MGNTVFRPTILQEDLDEVAEGHSVLRDKLQQGALPDAYIHVSHSLIPTERPFRCSLLTYALIKKDDEALQLLLAAGANTELGCGLRAWLAVKPLHVAAMLGLSGAASQLLLRGADPNATVMPSSLPDGHIQISEAHAFRTCLFKVSAGDTPLHIAAQRQHADVVHVLMGSPTTVPNILNAHSLTPLSAACGQGYSTIASILLADRRIDPNAGAPLQAAIRTRNDILVRALLAAGASAHASSEDDANSESPLQAALTHGSVVFFNRAAIVEALCAAGARVNQPVAPRITPLDYANAKGWPRVRAVLLRYGARHYIQLAAVGAEGDNSTAQNTTGAATAASSSTAAGTAPQPAAAANVGAASIGNAGTFTQTSATTSTGPPTPMPLHATSTPADHPARGVCGICLSEEPTHGFVHPGIVHACLCAACAVELVRRGKNVSRCLYCNSKVSGDIVRIVFT